MSYSNDDHYRRQEEDRRRDEQRQQDDQRRWDQQQRDDQRRRDDQAAWQRRQDEQRDADRYRQTKAEHERQDDEYRQKVDAQDDRRRADYDEWRARQNPTPPQHPGANNGATAASRVQTAPAIGGDNPFVPLMSFVMLLLLLAVPGALLAEGIEQLATRFPRYALSPSVAGQMAKVFSAALTEPAQVLWGFMRPYAKDWAYMLGFFVAADLAFLLGLVLVIGSYVFNKAIGALLSLGLLGLTAAFWYPVYVFRFG